MRAHTHKKNTTHALNLICLIHLLQQHLLYPRLVACRTTRSPVSPHLSEGARSKRVLLPPTKTKTIRPTTFQFPLPEDKA